MINYVIALWIGCELKGVLDRLMGYSLVKKSKEN